MLERERVLLTALLRDLGNIYHRTGFSEPYELFLPEPFREAINTPQEQPETPIPILDRLAPVAERITLQSSQKEGSDYTYRYPLAPLSATYEELMPKKAEEFTGNLTEQYQYLWQAFVEEMKLLQEQENFEAYFFTLYFLLKKYFSRVPTAEAIDISFFDHARVTAAMEDCRYQYRQEKQKQDQKNDTKEEEFLLIEGGVSGIQNFLFNMLSSQQERARLAKRLRGRSCYLSLLTETIADYLLKELELTITHQLWCSGGHFLIIAPNMPKVTYHLKACYQHINTFLIQKFRGALGCTLRWGLASNRELTSNFYRVRQRLSEKAELEKRRELLNVLDTENNVHFPSKPQASEEEILFTAPADRFVQNLNKEHERIGTVLANIDKQVRQRNLGIWLAKNVTPVSKDQKKHLLTTFQIGTNYQVAWMLHTDIINSADALYLLNETKDFQKSGVAKSGFKFMAIHVDTYSEQEAKERRESVGDIKGFEELAAVGSGGFLGVLRMDVDHLGAVFSIGIRPKEQQSIARIASLSSNMELFFTGHFQNLCATTFKKYTYVAYSGGDDLLVVGAWDTMLELACQVRKDFKTFTCHNEDLNISGGLFLCKGKYPIHRAAGQAQYLLDNLAKENEKGEKNLKGAVTQRNAFAMFNHRMEWEEFLDLKTLGTELIEAIDEKRLTRAHLYKILDLHRTWEIYRNLNIARMYYVTVRNIQDPYCHNIMIKKLAKHEYLSNQGYIPILVGSIALKTRAMNKEEHYE